MSLGMLVPVAKSLTTSLPHTQLTSCWEDRIAGEHKKKKQDVLGFFFVRVYKTAEKEIQ